MISLLAACGTFQSLTELDPLAGCILTLEVTKIPIVLATERKVW